MVENITIEPLPPRAKYWDPDSVPATDSLRRCSSALCPSVQWYPLQMCRNKYSSEALWKTCRQSFYLEPIVWPYGFGGLPYMVPCLATLLLHNLWMLALVCR